MHPDLLNNPTFLRYYETWQRDPTSLVFAPLADFFCQYKLFADARKICEAGVRNNPNSVLAHYSMAKVYTYTREWHAAKHEAQWVLAHTPKHEAALEILQRIEQGQHQTVDVRTVTVPKVVEVVVPTPVIPAVLPDSGMSQRESRSEVTVLDPRSSVKSDAGMTKSAAKPPRKSWQTVTMAKIYIQQGHLFKARTIYKTILMRDPKNVEALAGLTSLERQMRDAATA